MKPVIKIKSIGLITAIALVCVTISMTALSCSGEQAPDGKNQTVASTAVKATKLTEDDLTKLESVLAESRADTPPNYPDDPILLVKSDWPYQWKGFGNPFQLRPDEEVVFPTAIKHQDPPELSEAELMFAFGWVHKNAEGFYRLSDEEKLLFHKQKKTIDERGFRSFKVHPAKEVASNWTSYFLATGKKAKRLVEVANWKGCDKLILEGSQIEKSDSLDRITSPLTGKILEITHPEFSPGNMYIDAFTPSQLREIKGFNISKFEEVYRHQNIPEKDVVISFYRIYGTKGVIKTGWFIRSLSNPNVMSEAF